MNALQAKIAELMQMSSFNDFDGTDVVSSLDEHDDLWLTFYPVAARGDGMMLNNLVHGNSGINTLLVLCPNMQTANELANIALDPDGVWNADEAITIVREPKGKNQWQLDGARCILKVWWD